ncbi:MAG: DUF917 domain-containing protein [Dermatophilaceae bacterium]|nr:DUF917 domain-containing protein [Intrasporangiaceae bacterium]
MTEPRTLSTDELDLILQGACFLGSGGGGPLELGRQFIDDIATSENPVRVVDVASVPPDARGAISAGVGSPTAAASGFPSDAAGVAWRELEAVVGHPFSHIVPAEVGAGNTFIPFLLSAQTGLPVIDGAGADRAVPSLPLCTFAAAEVPLGTIVLGNSDLVLRFAGSDPAAADTRMRSLLSGGAFAEDAGSAMWAMDGTQIAAGAIRGTTSRALQVGTLLSESSDPIEDVAAHLGGSVLVRGTITDIGEVTGGGFDTGHVTITASGTSAYSVTVGNVNENLIAFSGQSPTVLATAPDLLCYVSAAGEAFSNAEAAAYRDAGTEVALVVVPSSPQMRSTSLLDGFRTVLASVGYYGPLVLLPNPA